MGLQRKRKRTMKKHPIQYHQVFQDLFYIKEIFHSAFYWYCLHLLIYLYSIIYLFLFYVFFFAFVIFFFLMYTSKSLNTWPAGQVNKIRVSKFQGMEKVFFFRGSPIIFYILDWSTRKAYACYAHRHWGEV